MEIKSFCREAATRKLFWRFWLARPEWAAPKRFGFEYCPAQLGGVLYAGIVLFGWTLIYSSEW
jgi:hypothetical protein